MKRALFLLVLVACKKEPLASQPVDAGPGWAPPNPELVAIADASGDPCMGGLVDLARLLRETKCRVAFDARPPKGAYDQVDIRFTGSAPKVPRGGAVDFELVLTNRGGAAVPLLLDANGFGLSVHDATDRPTSFPNGKCPCPATLPETTPAWAKVVLPPRGELRARYRWHATKTKLGSCSQGSTYGCIELPDGALAPGVYKARIRVPLWTRHGEEAAHPDWAQEWPGALREVPIAVE